MADAVKGFGQTKRFIANTETRIDRNQACYMPAMTINRWLAVRLEFLGSCLMFSTALTSVSALLISNSVDAGLVGLMMTYTISVTGVLVCPPLLRLLGALYVDDVELVGEVCL